MSSENKQLIRRMYDAYIGGDLESILAKLTDDFAWNVPGPVPFAGRRTGAAGMREFFAAMASAVQVDQFDVDDILADGDKVVVLGRERATVRETGRHYETDFAHVWTLRDGKIVQGQVFADTAAGGAAFGESTREREALTGSLGITHTAFSGRGTPE
jgi:ketosteroid isomerase-like protein